MAADLDEIPTIERFLEGLKLSQLIELFHTKEIHNVHQCIDFEDEELKELGIEKPGHRKRIYVELKSLRMRLKLEQQNGTQSTVTEIVNNSVEQPGQNAISEEHMLYENETKEEDEPPPVIPVKKNSRVQPPIPLPRKGSAPPIPVHSPVSPTNKMPQSPTTTTDEPQHESYPHEVPPIPVHFAAAEPRDLPQPFEEPSETAISSPSHPVPNEVANVGSLSPTKAAPPIPARADLNEVGENENQEPAVSTDYNGCDQLKNNTESNASSDIFHNQSIGNTGRAASLDIEHNSLGDTPKSLHPAVPLRPAITRAASVPVKKRLAPKPPAKGASMNKAIGDKLNSMLQGQRREPPKTYDENISKVKSTQGSDPQTNQPAEENSIYETIADLAPEMRPTAPSIVKDEGFRNKLANIQFSPKRPAPGPPIVVTPDGRDDDGSSESEEETTNIEKQDSSSGMKSLLSDEELQEKGKTVPMNKRMSRLSFSRSGYLDKRGGQNNDRRLQKRWVEFNGTDLRYYKPNDKDKSDCLQIVPISRMTGVKIDVVGKKHQFSLDTPNRTFIFASEDVNEVSLWSNILMQAIIHHKESAAKETEDPVKAAAESIGGSMANPDKEGWLKKQGHNMRQDWKSRYVVVKGCNVAYYRGYEDYKQDIQINCLPMALSTLKMDSSRCRLTIKTAQEKDFVFEASDDSSYQSWMNAFQTSIQMAFADMTVLEAIQENASNNNCADCGKRNPIYASVNLLVVVCDQCIGCHRRLGAQITKSRSVLMDLKIWSEPLKKLMQVVGNANANKFWERKMPEDDKITPDTSSDERYEFIVSKYKEKRYINFSQYYGQKDNLGQALRANVVTDDIITTLQLIVCGASVYYNTPEDERTPYDLATEANQELQMANFISKTILWYFEPTPDKEAVRFENGFHELLRQFNGHLTAEEREKEEREEAERLRKANEEIAASAARQPAYEKQGVLLKRGPKNNEPWKQRVFYLQKRSLSYQKEKEREVIDLTEAVDILLGANENEPRSINIVLPTRTYYLKGETIADAESWYWAIKNKQVFGVAIENQELTGKSVPLLVAKCVDYVETYALTEEGIYRKNGSTITIKNLKLTFNQDAPNVRLTFDDYPVVHDICGVLKLYFREGLLEPLMTNALYKEFIANSVDTDHDRRLSTLYALVRRLPDVNMATLKCIVLHLDKVTKYSDQNKMTMLNVIRVFAPIILNQGKSTNERELAREYQILDDILTYHAYLFDIDTQETKRREQQIEQGMQKMKDAMQEIVKVTNSVKIDDLQTSVLIDDGQRSCTVKVNSKTCASEVCLYIIRLLSLSYDNNWALFERVGIAGFERPLHSKDLVFPLLMESGKWGDQSRYTLCIKSNYVAEKSAPYQDGKLSLTGKLHLRKNDSSWREQFFMVKFGDLVVFTKERGSEVERLSIHQWTLYVGNDERSKKKPPKKHGFTLINGDERRCMCTDDEKYMYTWISSILQIKYPGGIWTNLNEAERRMTMDTTGVVPLDQRKSVYLGRQSTYIREQGSSSHVQKELQVKRRSLKKVR